MKAYIDLHIHSTLSPCADEDMTPNNIVGMAFLKGLNIIAVTDHNSIMNVKATMECAFKYGIKVIPGIELETKEEVHVICLLPSLEKAESFQELVWGRLPNLKNRPEIFGQQYVMDSEDNIIESVDKLLITATDICIDELFNIVENLGGVCIPAHVDRNSYSLIGNLGLIPESLPIKYIEISKNCSTEFLQRNTQLLNYKLLKSSDAHHLGDILEHESYLELPEVSISALLQKLKY